MSARRRERGFCAISVATLAASAAAQDVPRVDKIEVVGHYDNRVGTSDAASAGVITPQLIDDRPLLRPGEVLEYIPGMIVTQHSGAGKANQYFLSSSTTVFNAQVTYQVNAQTRLRFDVFNLFDSRTNDIAYYYSSRLPGEPVEGVADIHFHPMESRSLRLGLLYNF